jgi:mannitol-1-phosphate 5-dehydrogenase
MGHVITAYYGFLSDCKYISDAVRNPAIRTIVEKAMEQSALALSRKYGIDICSIREHIDNLLYRFENPLLMDTVSRVGRDPVRKLAPNDRLTGALLLCREQDCPSTYISAGIAAGLCFDANEDEKAAEVSGVVRLEGFEEALRKYCSISRDDPEYNHIKTIFDMINRKEELSNIQKKCEVL